MEFQPGARPKKWELLKNAFKSFESRARFNDQAISLDRIVL
jgi:hypothetical protein